MKLNQLSQNKVMLNEKKEEKHDIIPHLHSDDVNYETHKAYIDMIKDVDPVLYKKIINWE